MSEAATGWLIARIRSDREHTRKEVGTMAVHVVPRWTYRIFSDLKRSALGTYHGPRHTVGATLADAGATPQGIADVLGCTLGVAETYVRGRRRDLHAAAGAARLERHRNG